MCSYHLMLSHCSLVLHCQDLDAYIHRSGRTGRAGRSGVSIMFYKSSQEAELKEVEKAAVSWWEENRWMFQMPANLYEAKGVGTLSNLRGPNILLQNRNSINDNAIIFKMNTHYAKTASQMFQKASTSRFQNSLNYNLRLSIVRYKISGHFCITTALYYSLEQSSHSRFVVKNTAYHLYTVSNQE